MATKIQFRRDTAANWTATNPIMSEGEMGLDLTNNSFKVGDGVSNWNTLVYSNVPASDIDTLTDVTITTPSIGEVIKWDGSKWINGPDATAGGTTELNTLADVSIISPVLNNALVYNGTSWINQALTGTGTVTSIDMTVPTGLSISGNPITTAGTLSLSLTAGYTIPTSTAMASAATAFGWGDHSLPGYLTDLTTLSTTNLAEGTNLYYTEGRVSANSAVALNTAKISFDSTSSTKLGTIQEGAQVNPTNTDSIAEGTTNFFYTDARADARVALLVDAAPATLNTLNELAAALGDDPNFATTISTAIGVNDTARTSYLTTFNGNNQLVQLNGTGQLPALDASLLTGVVASLDDLTDVVITTPTDTQVLTFNGTNWVNADAGGLGIETVGDLTDVDTTTTAPVTGDILEFDGTNWVNTTPSGGGATTTFTNLTSTYPATGSASTDITDWAITMSAGKTYEIDMFIVYGLSGSTSYTHYLNVRYDNGLVVTSKATNFVLWKLLDPAQLETQRLITANPPVNMSLEVASASSNNVGRFKSIVTCSTSGTYSFFVKGNNGGAGTLYLSTSYAVLKVTEH